MRFLDQITKGLSFFARLTSPEQNRGGRLFLPFGGGRDGLVLSHEQALRLSAVWACITVIAKSLASCRWEVFLEDINGDRELQRKTTTWRLLNQRPNDEMTAISFHEATLITALVFGDAFAEIENDTQRRPAALWPLSPERCTLDRNDAGQRILRVTNAGAPDSDLPYSSVYHIHGPGLDGLCGHDVVALASRTIAQGLAAERFGQKFYENGTQMGGVVETPAKMTQPQVQDLRQQINARHQGVDKAFNFLVLHGGAKWVDSSVEPDKAQFIETRYLIIEETCRWFGVPPHKIAHLLRSTFSNIEHQGLEFVRDALTPWAERAAQECDTKLLPVQGRFKVRIDTDWLGEGDAKSKADTDSILVRSGLATRNERRRLRGYNRVGSEGDALTVEASLANLKAVVSQTTRPAPTNPQQPPPEPTDAAQALYASALKRSLLRFQHRVIQAAMQAKTPGDFRSRFAAVHSAHALYTREQIDEVHRVLRSVNVHVDESAALEKITASVNEDRNLVLRAYDDGRADSWADPEQRAEQIAAELSTGTLTAR